MWLWSSIEILVSFTFSRDFRRETVVSKARNLYYFNQKQQQVGKYTGKHRRK